MLDDNQLVFITKGEAWQNSTEYFWTGRVIWYTKSSYDQQRLSNRPDVDEKKVRLKIIVVVIQNWVVRFGHVDTHRRETWADYPRSLGGIAPQQYPDDVEEEEEGSWSKREQKFI